MTLNIDPGGDVLTAEQFAGLTARDKGFTVYMCGCRDDQPNVPEEYEPAPGEAGDYAAGQQAAIVATMDVDG